MVVYDVAASDAFWRVANAPVSDSPSFASDPPSASTYKVRGEGGGDFGGGEGGGGEGGGDGSGTDGGGDGGGGKGGGGEGGGEGIP